MHPTAPSPSPVHARSIPRSPVFQATLEERGLAESYIEEAFLDGSVTSMEKLVIACTGTRSKGSSVQRRDGVSCLGAENQCRFLNLQHSGTGLTPLAVAVIHGYQTVVDYFLKHGADPTIRTTNGYDCFKWADEYHRDAVRHFSLFYPTPLWDLTDPYDA